MTLPPITAKSLMAAGTALFAVASPPPSHRLYWDVGFTELLSLSIGIVGSLQVDSCTWHPSSPVDPSRVLHGIPVHLSGLSFYVTSSGKPSLASSQSEQMLKNVLLRDF